MDQEELGGAQGHWRECRLQAGQPVDGRGHFLRGGTQRLRGMGLRRGGSPPLGFDREWGGGWLGEGMEPEKLGMGRN